MMDWIDEEKEQEFKNELKRKSKDPDEWKEIQQLEQELREENQSLVPAQVEVRAPVKEAPNSTAVKADQLGVPKFCDQCYLIDKCPHYKPKATCYFQNSVKINGPQDLLELTKMLLEIQGERIMFGRFIEQAEGGYIDANLSKEMRLMMDLMKDFKELVSQPQDEISIKIKGNPAKAAGDAQAQQGGGGGILSAIFGNNGN